MKSGGNGLSRLSSRTADHAGRMHEADIKAHLLVSAARGVIPKFGIPEKIEFVDALAKTSVGKFDKKLLRETYAHIAPDSRQARAERGLDSTR